MIKTFPSLIYYSVEVYLIKYKLDFLKFFFFYVNILFCFNLNVTFSSLGHLVTRGEFCAIMKGHSFSQLISIFGEFSSIRDQGHGLPMLRRISICSKVWPTVHCGVSSKVSPRLMKSQLGWR